MANTLRFKRGLVSGIPTAALGEPLFTTDTFDLYIGNGTGNTRFQKYIASGTTSQLLRGDGSLLTMPIVLTSPANGEVLKYNGTNWVNSSDAGITGSGTTNYLPKFTGASTLGNSNIVDISGNVLMNLSVVPSGWAASSLMIKQTTAFGYNGIAVFSSTNNNATFIGNTGSLAVIGSEFGTGGAYTPLSFQTNGTERMRLDNSGNLGLGVTPSAWGTTNFTRALELSTGSLWAFGGTSSLYLSSNIYYNGSARIYKNTGTASEYAQISGSHQWYTAASGSAGGTVTLTQPMTLTANGRLLLGTTTEGTFLLDVNGIARISGTTGLSLLVGNNTATSTATPLVVSLGATFGSNTAGSTSNIKLRLYDDGTASAYYGIGVSNTLLEIHSNNNIGFFTGGTTTRTEHVRINLSGSMGIGATTLGANVLKITKNITGNNIANGVLVDALVNSDVTTVSTAYTSNIGTVAASFTNTSLVHFYATQGTFGAGSTVTNQFGFLAENTLIGATNDYGFYGNIASGTGRWNLYMNGTAANYLNGNLLISSTSDTGEKLQVNGTSIFRNDMQLSKTTASLAEFIINDGFTSSATTEARLRVQASSTQGYIIAQGPLKSSYKIQGPGDFSIYKSGTDGNITILNDRSTGNILMAAGGSSTAQLTLNASGNLGLGTASPTSLAGYTSLAVNNATNGGNIDLMTAGTRHASWNNTATETYFGTRSNTPLIITTNATEVAKFYANGNFRVGAAAADSGEKLQVNGTMKVTGETSIVTGGNAILNIDGLSTSTSGLIIKGSGVERGRISFSNSTTMRFFIGSGVTQYLEIDATTRAATFSSSVTGGSFIPTSSTIPTNGMYLGAANQLNFATNSTSRLNISGTGVATFSSTINVGGTATFTNASSVNIVGTSTLVGATARNTSSASGDTQAGFFVENGTSNGQLYKAGTGYTTRKTIVANDLGFYNAAAGNISILNDFASGNINFAAGGSSTAQWTIGTNGDLTAADGENIIVGTTNGTKIGTSSSQKLGFWNATPIAQPNNSIAAANFVAGIGTTVTTLDAFDGYTIGQVVKALRNAGILS